jgi:hypothetical protein
VMTRVDNLTEILIFLGIFFYVAFKPFHNLFFFVMMNVVMIPQSGSKP